MGGLFAAIFGVAAIVYGIIAASLKVPILQTLNGQNASVGKKSIQWSALLEQDKDSVYFGLKGSL